MTGEPILLQEQAGGVVTLTLNRPKAFNSLSLALLQAIDAALQSLAGDQDARVIVFKGAGDRAFCSGHDLKEIGRDLSEVPVKALFEQCSAMMLRILQQPQPVIAAVDGIATAAGCQLVAACDLAIATPRSTFATSGVKYGLFCSTPMVALGRAVHRKAAMEMLLTGDFIDAETAKNYGLINQITDDLDAGVAAMCDRLCDKPRDVLALGKQAFYRQLEMGISDAYAFTSDVITGNALMPDFAEGLAAFQEKRRPNWPASSKTAAE